MTTEKLPAAWENTGQVSSGGNKNSISMISCFKRTQKLLLELFMIASDESIRHQS